MFNVTNESMLNGVAVGIATIKYELQCNDVVYTISVWYHSENMITITAYHRDTCIMNMLASYVDNEVIFNFGSDKTRWNDNAYDLLHYHVVNSADIFFSVFDRIKNVDATMVLIVVLIGGVLIVDAITDRSVLKVMAQAATRSIQYSADYNASVYGMLFQRYQFLLADRIIK